MNNISGMAHDGQICKDIERRLNSLIREINETGGMIWLQAKSNKEHYYELTEEVSIGFMIYTTTAKEEESK